MTRTRISALAALALWAGLGLSAVASQPVGSGFTYQGRLLEAGEPVDGLADLSFRLFDEPTAGNQVGSTISALDVPIDGGQFTVDLDFGVGTFDGNARWLEIEVNGVVLDPRQPMMPAPYALYSVTGPGIGTGGASWQYRDDDITTMASVGIGTSDPSYPLHLVTDGTWGLRSYASGTGVYGRHTNTTGTFPGVWGETDSLSSGAAGVRAIVTSTTPGGNSAGLLAINNSTTANGVGIKAQHNGSGHAVHGISTSGFAGYFEGDGYFADFVGIGTTAPQSRLHVSGLGETHLILEADTSNSGGEDQNARVVYRQDGGTVTAREGLNIDNNFEMIHEHNSDLILGTSNLERLRITDSGNVGIGTTAPAGLLHVASGGETEVMIEAYDGDARMQFFRTGGDVSGHVGQEGVALELMQHQSNPLVLGTDSSERMRIAGNGFVGIGTNNPQGRLHVINLGPDPALRVSGIASVTLLEITGADLAEKFPVSEVAEPGTVMAIDPDNPGTLRVARGAYNRRVAGVVSGANGLPAGAILGHLPGFEDAPPIALSGRVWVKCDAGAGPITAGDLLTTSATPGHAMRVADHDRAPGAVIGKAMTSLDSGAGMVLVLVSLQ